MYILYAYAKTLQAYDTRHAVREAQPDTSTASADCGNCITIRQESTSKV